MPDHLTPEQRHRNMAAIRGKDTKPEIIVRKYLWRHGFRYRLNHRGLPGKPDIVLRRYRTCIFVNGCFWHGHNLALSEEVQGDSKVQEVQSSDCCKIPTSNREFWLRKMARNQERDLEVQHRLARMGWHSITIWECELKDNRTLQPGEKSKRERTLESLLYTLNRIYLQDHRVKTYVIADDEPQRMVADESEVYD